MTTFGREADRRLRNWIARIALQAKIKFHEQQIAVARSALEKLQRSHEKQKELDESK